MSSAVTARPRARRAILASVAALAAVGTAASCTPPTSPQAQAKNQLVGYGWGNNTQFNCLNSLWIRESGWRWNATNPYSGAYGIPQALPASKMGSAGADWRTNSATQIRWGLNYIRAVYGSPCGAWRHSEATGWY